ncbi:uncharacterized protein N7483_010450 [Penicillium malachiteum]|uniref:uncharacterized protein n=1 Tax=Penicillium malachiteum TaxID=1324776 RepID=UPI0025488AFA|nr:uncharacterized protein N7483_010450 [Penicillium malachiteum]KAJ5713269.1 hypothetical protein N7483_010450 [Penicillium malachiteum]
MKLSILYLLAFSSGGFTSPIKRTNSFQVQDFNASVYSNNTLGTLQFAVQNPSNSLGDQCFISCRSIAYVNTKEHCNFEYLISFAPYTGV